jgi:TPR repeat protein
MYKPGQGVEQSHPESIKWMQASANQGYAEAQSNLGDLYYQGLGVI